MNINNMLVYNALSFISGVVDVKQTITNNKLQITLVTKHNKRKRIQEKVMALLEIYELQPKLVNSDKSSIGIIDTNEYEVLVKPLLKNNSKHNETRLVDLFHEYKPKSIMFIDVNNNKFLLDDVKDVLDRQVSNKRCTKTLKVNKEDICIHTESGFHPISLKMTGGATFWESADSILNDRASEILTELINRFDIKNFDGRKLKRDIIIDKHDYGTLSGCVYGNDILPSGCVAVTNFDSFDYYNTTLTINCDRVFTGNDVLFDSIYAPVSIISKCKNRNINHKINKHLVSKVCTKLRAKNAININKINHISEIYDEHKVV